MVHVSDSAFYFTSKSWMTLLSRIIDRLVNLNSTELLTIALAFSKTFYPPDDNFKMK